MADRIARTTEPKLKIQHNGDIHIHREFHTSSLSKQGVTVEFIEPTNLLLIFYFVNFLNIQGVTRGMCETSGECSLGQAIPI